MHMRAKTIIAIAALFAISALFESAALADKVTLANGDTVTGQIKGLDDGILHLDYFKQSLELPWQEVAAVESQDNLHVVLKDGQTLVGILRASATGFELATSAAGTVNITKDSIQIIRSRDAEAAYQAEIARLRNPGLLDLWRGFLDTGLAASQGNAETTTFNVGFNGARISPRDKISVFITSLYARSNTSGIALTTANAVRGGFRYDVNVNERLFSFGFTELDYDEFQGLDLRFVPGGGFGFRWLKNDRTRFDIFGGGSLNREFFRGDIDRTSGELVLGEELFHQLLSVMHLEHKLTFYPNLSNTGEYRVSLDNGFITRLSNWLSLQLTLSDRLNSNPIPGKKKNDILFTSGLRFTFE
jgi:putative salt-induced outer membrane protein